VPSPYRVAVIHGSGCADEGSRAVDIVRAARDGDRGGRIDACDRDGCGCDRARDRDARLIRERELIWCGVAAGSLRPDGRVPNGLVPDLTPVDANGHLIWPSDTELGSNAAVTGNRHVIYPLYVRIDVTCLSERQAVRLGLDCVHIGC
jgi:hypothetical protein